MNYLLLPFLALGISCSIYPMKREAPNDEKNNEHPKKIAKTNQLSPLMQAIVNKNKEKIQELCVSADEINKPDEESYVPLITALSYGDKETIEFLLAHGARASSEDASNDFLLAVIKGDLQRVSELIKSGIDINASGYAGYTALICASTLRYREIAQVLIAAGCNLHARNVKGRQALHLASLKGGVELVKLLIGSEADVNHHDDKGSTPLMLAAQKGFIEIADMLLKAGALLQYSSNSMLTPLMSAISNNQEEMVKFLLKAGVSVNQIWDSPTRKGITPLSYAVERGFKEVVKILLDAKAYINPQDSNGWSPLIIAVRRQGQDMGSMGLLANKEIVDLLIQAGANVNQQDSKKCTPLIHAALVGVPYIAEMLLNAKADVNLTNNYGNAALSIAIANKQEEMVKFLLKAGASVDQLITDKIKTTTPLIYALELGLTGIVKVLLDAKVNVNQQATNLPPLIIALRRQGQDKEIVKLLLEAGANVNTQDEIGQTPLHYATREGRKDIVELLLNAGADVKRTNKFGHTALTIAINNKYDEVAKELVLQGADANSTEYVLTRAVMSRDVESVKKWLALGVNINVNQQDPQGSTPLHGAIFMNAPEIIKILLDAGADVNVANNVGSTPLSLALSQRLYELMHELVRRGANVNQQDAKGNTLLMGPYGSREAVKILLDVGADVSITNNSGENPLTQALLRNDHEIIKELCDAKVNFNSRFSDGNTALIWAVKKGNQIIIERLLKLGADVNQADNKGWTPLMCAAQGGNAAIIKILLEAGADPKDGDTPLSIAVSRSEKQLAKELIGQGADVNLKYVNGKTLLTQAIANKDKEMVELLLEGKADVNQKDAEGRTPLMSAAESGNDAMIDLLLKYEADISIGDYSMVTAASDKGHIELVTKLLALVPKKKNRKVLAHTFDRALKNGSLELVNRTLALKPNLAEQFLPGSANVSPLMFLGRRDLTLKMARLLKEEAKIAELEAKSKRATELGLLITLCQTKEILEFLGKKPGALAIVERHLEGEKYIRTEYKQTVLMWAAMFGHNDAVKKILSTLVPIKKKQPLPLVADKAVRANNTLLDRAVRYINAQDVRGRTALMYAIVYGYSDIAQTLIPYCGSSINIKDENGYSALDYAARRGSIQLIKMLLSKGARITTPAIKEAAEENNDQLAVSLLGEKMGRTMFGTLT
jgi:ankyrin repeat protein